MAASATEAHLRQRLARIRGVGHQQQAPLLVLAERRVFEASHQLDDVIGQELQDRLDCVGPAAARREMIARSSKAEASASWRTGS